jgi:hypothetical protein
MAEAAHAIIAELGRDTPDADLKLSLGAPESSRGDVFDWASGASDDREYGQDELEPSLGSSSALNQTAWGSGSCSDLEHEHDGREMRGRQTVGQHIPASVPSQRAGEGFGVQPQITEVRWRTSRNR